jgi:hypothetical protein
LEREWKRGEFSAVDEGKWVGGDPPFPIFCGGGEREPQIIISSDVGMYKTKKIKDEVDRSTRWWGSVNCDG